MPSDQSEVKELLLKAVKNEKLKDLTELINQYGLSYCPDLLDGYVLLCVAIRYLSGEAFLVLLEKGAKLNSKNDSALHLAVDENIAGMVERLLEYEVEVNFVRLRDNYTPLHVACVRGIEVIITMLLKNGADPNVEADDGVTPLHLSCQEGCANIVGLLLKHGAKVNCTRLPDKYTPLHVICAGIQIDTGVEIVDQLLKGGADPDARANDYTTPLHLALQKEHMEIFTLLLNYNAEVNCFRLPDKYTPLHIACKKGLDKIVDQLLECGADPNAKANNSITPLHLAAQQKNVGIVKSLLEHGAKINCARLSDDYTPLHIACQKGLNKMVEYLLNIGANPNIKANNNVTSLHLAAEKFNSVNIAESLLNHGAEVNVSRLSDNYTPLHVACTADSHGLNKMVDILLKHGADPNARTNDKITPLHLVAKTSDLKTLATLLNHGAKVNCTRREDLFTPLLIACENKSDEIVEMLLNSGADPNIRSYFDITPLHLAVKAENLKMVRSLLRYGAQVDYQTPTADVYEFPCNSAPLHVACTTHNRDIVDLLLENNANPNVKTKKNSTPLHLAVQRVEKDIVKSLLKYGANVNCSRNLNEYTPLHIACDKWSSIFDIEIICLLLKNDADPNIKAEKNFTPLHLAVKQKNVDAIKELLGNFADINLETVAGQTPLHLALNKREEKCASIIMNHAIKIKAAGLYISEKILHLLKRIGFQERNFQEKCEEEVKQMKFTQITSHFTVFDILKNWQYPAYARNESLVQSLMSFNYKKFSNYHGLLVNYLKKSKQRIELLTSGEKSLSVLLKMGNVLNEKSLPDELLREIVFYLNDEDLRNLSVCADYLISKSNNFEVRYSLFLNAS